MWIIPSRIQVGLMDIYSLMTHSPSSEYLLRESALFIFQSHMSQRDQEGQPLDLCKRIVVQSRNPLFQVYFALLLLKSGPFMAIDFKFPRKNAQPANSCTCHFLPSPFLGYLASSVKTVGLLFLTEYRTRPFSHQSICQDSFLFTSKTRCFSLPVVQPNSIVFLGTILPLTDVGNQLANPFGVPINCQARDFLQGSATLNRVRLPLRNGF